MSKQPSPIHHALATLIRKHSPRGLYTGEARDLLEKSGLGPLVQSHLDRRMRELPRWWPIVKHRDGRVIRYSL